MPKSRYEPVKIFHFTHCTDCHSTNLSVLLGVVRCDDCGSVLAGYGTVLCRDCAAPCSPSATNGLCDGCEEWYVSLFGGFDAGHVSSSQMRLPLELFVGGA